MRELLALVLSASVRCCPTTTGNSSRRRSAPGSLDAFGFERRDLGSGVPQRGHHRHPTRRRRGYVDVDVLHAIAESELSAPAALARTLADLAGAGSASHRRRAAAATRRSSADLSWRTSPATLILNEVTHEPLTDSVRAAARRPSRARRAAATPLRALLAVIAEQVDVVEDDIARLYGNWFIETCDDWVVPYIGDLIGYRAGARSRRAWRPDAAARAARVTASSSRAARSPSTIAYRRRKGTLALLEQLGNESRAGRRARSSSTGCSAGRSTSTTCTASRADARRAATAMRSTSSRPVRTARAHRGRPAHRTPTGRTGPLQHPEHRPVRVAAESVLRQPHERRGQRLDVAGRMDAGQLHRGRSPHCYTFSVLGNRHAALQPAAARRAIRPHIAGEMNVPAPIRRRALRHAGASCDRPSSTARGRAWRSGRPGWPVKSAPQPIPADARDPGGSQPAGTTTRHATTSPSIQRRDASRSRRCNCRRRACWSTTTTASAPTSAAASTRGRCRSRPGRARVS